MSEPAQESDWQNLSVEEQLTHKLWKARLAAYERLIKQFEMAEGDDDEVFADWNRDQDWPKRAVTDSNAVAQEKGIYLLSVYIRLAGRPATRCRPDCITPLVEKSLATNARKGTREAGIECLLGWTVIEADVDKAEGILTAVLEGLGSKQPKVVAGAVSALNALISAFGVRIINIKPVLKSLAKIFAHPDKGVRAEGTTLVQTIYTFLGAALDPSLSELKPVQVKELHESFAALDTEGKGKGSGQPTRESAGQQRDRMQREAQLALEGATEADLPAVSGDADEAEPQEDAQEFDPYELADPIAILDRLPSGFYEHLASSKWKERKEEALDPLHEVLRIAIKIKPDHYDELIKALATRMGDANILCVIGAANCLQCLAKGLRSDFGKYKSLMLVPMLEKFKERKVNVVEALSNCLDAMALTVTLPELTEDIVTFSKHKNPQVKEQTMKFLVRCLRNTEHQIPKQDIKPLSDVMLSGLEDAVVPVREVSAEGLGTMMKLVGRATFSPLIQGQDDLRKAKVEEYFESAVVKYKPPKAKPKVAPAKPPSKAPLKPKPAPKQSTPASPEFDEFGPSAVSKPVSTAPTKQPAKKPAAAAATGAAAPRKNQVAGQSSGASKVGSRPIEDVRYKMSQEDAEAKALDCLDPSFIESIGNSLWKTRLAALDEILAWLPEHTDDLDAEIIVRYLNKKPGPKESNFQVWQRVFAVIQVLAESFPTFSKACIALTVPSLIEKYGDAKIKESASIALVTCAEKSSLGFVLSHAFEPISKQKAVKIQAESFLFIEMALREFGISGVPVRDLIECLKTGLKSVNAAVRTNATKALVMTRICIGADITNFLQDLNPQLLGTIENEFSKNEGEAPPVPTRHSVDITQNSSGAANGTKGKGKVAAGDDPLDELFPRVDLDKVLPSAVVKACDDGAWKIRKEALETIQGILDQNKRLKPVLGSDLAASLKLRLSDANKAVQGLALDITSRLATGMGKPFERHVKIFATPVLMVLADKNAGARNNALTTLSCIADACGLDCITANVAAALEIAKPELRASALSWIVNRFLEPEAVKGLDLSPFAAPLISCLEDRSPEVRKGAQALLPTVVQSAGIDIVLEQTSGLKPASRNNVVPMIEAFRPSAPVKAAAPRTAATKTMARPASALNKSVNRASSVAGSHRAPAPALEERPPASKARLGARKPVAAMVSSKLGPPPPIPPSPGPAASTSAVPFRTGDPKAKALRASKEMGPLKWVIEGAVRKDQIEQLHLQMTPQVSAELLGQLFSKDHHCEKDFMAALNVIESWTSDPSVAAETADLEESDIRDRLLANSDLVFKYLTVRLHDTNTSITMKCLDIIEQYITVLQLDAYRLTDYEASALLPSLIGRCGDSKEVLRARIRAIFKHLCSIYPFSKVFQSLLDHGIKSKNARVRAECAEELSALFQRHGLNVSQPAKALPLIASLISDRDSAVRNGALSALASAYASAGDVILKYVGHLSGKEQDMLTERLKRTGAPASPKPSRVAPTTAISPRQAAVARLAPKGLRRPSSTALHGPNDAVVSEPANAAIHQSSSIARPNSTSGVLKPAPAASPTPHRQSLSSVARGNTQSTLPTPKPLLQSSLRQPTNRVPVQAVPASPSGSDRASSSIPIAEILSSDDIRSTDALKIVQSDIAHRPESLIGNADALIDAIATQMRITFENLDASTPPLTLRLCKHLMQTLSTFFDQIQLATSVSKDALVAILAQLTQRLQETADNPVSEHITSLSKVLNMVLIRIFHNADRSACFGALFAVLKITTIDMRDIEAEHELAHRAKYAELVMKCLWKVSKTVKESLEDGSLDARILLRDIDDFLVSIPPAEWRRRANDNVPLADMPLRTVKTILQQVVTIYGDGVYDAVSALKNPQDTFVYQYLFRLLNNSKAAAGEPTVTHQASRPAIVAPPSPQPVATRMFNSISENHSRTHSPSRSRGSSVQSAEVLRPNHAPDHFGEVELNNHLTDVFARIGSPTESKKGIHDLYLLLKMHPEANVKVDKWIGATGTYFQAYLRRALNNLRADDPDVTAAENGPPLTPATRHSSNLISMTPSPSASNGFGEEQARMTKTISQDVDLNRLQSLFGFAANPNVNLPPTNASATTDLLD